MMSREVTFFEKKFHYHEKSQFDYVKEPENLVIVEDDEVPEKDVNDHEDVRNLFVDIPVDDEPLAERLENSEQVGEEGIQSKTYEELFMETFETSVQGDSKKSQQIQR